MMKKAKFAMAFHCYQPVFNFDEEIERAFRNAYLPLLKTLEEFPSLKASFHYSGNMLEWFERKHPDYIEKIKKLVHRKQVELIGGGCFEPVMALIPECDRRQQLKMNDEIFARIFGIKPEGAWIAERVWQPDLVDTLSASGVKYTIIDDFHMLKAGVEKRKVFRPHLMRRGNSSIVLFPSLTFLRYSIPFRLPAATLSYIKSVTAASYDDTTCFFFADDAEKFGLWPHTYRWVYSQGWLRNFFHLLKENSKWLETVTYSEVADTVTPGIVDKVPESSYAEMMEWSGGSFKNFLTKYPEADRMHRRMISVSNMISRIDSRKNSCSVDVRLREAKEELFKAQSNCAYWHGTFGGLYLPHLRSGVYGHLIKAENITSMLKKHNDKRIMIVEHDLELGSRGTRLASSRSKREVTLRNKHINIFIKSSEGAVVSELDYRPKNINLVNTISRIKENYHEKLKKGYSSRIKQARELAACGDDTVSIHDVLGVGEKGLKKILFYDDYQRSSFQTHILKNVRPPQRVCRSRGSYDSFLKGTYTFRSEIVKEIVTCVLSKRDRVLVNKNKPIDLEVIKKITLGTGPAVMFSHRCLNQSDYPIFLKYAVEFNFLIWDKRVLSKPRLIKADRFLLEDRYSGLSLKFLLDKKFTIFMYPVYTVNETECGLKKTFQGVSVLVGNNCKLSENAGKDDMRVTVAVGDTR